MRLLWLFCPLAGLLLGSAAPPAPLAGPKPQPDPFAIEALAEAFPAQAEIPAPAPVAVPALPPAEPLLRAPDPVAAPAPAAEPEPPEPAPPPRPRGDVTVVVSIPQQKAWVFKGSKLVASSPVSTGKKGHETPAGVFPILQKKVRHNSNKYDNAPMPYMQRLTWQGVALHAGHVPGYPASHGCIRLPKGFAKKLYGMTNYGTRVVVTKRRAKSAKDALAIA